MAKIESPNEIVHHLVEAFLGSEMVFGATSRAFFFFLNMFCFFLLRNKKKDGLVPFGFANCFVFLNKLFGET